MTPDLSTNALIATTGAMIVGKIIWDWLAMRKITGQTGTFPACLFTERYKEDMRDMRSMHKDEIRLLTSINENITKMTMLFESHTLAEIEMQRDIKEYMRGSDQKLERLLANSIRNRGE